MDVKHLNCGTMRPPGGGLISGTGHPVKSASLVTHCLLIETSGGLVLVDTGFGLGCVENPAAALGRAFVLNVRPRLTPADTAVRQVEALGHSASDVRHIVLTHLDADHAGGLPDFPAATVHVHEPEYKAAMSPESLGERQRYRQNLWAHGPSWATYGVTAGDRWFGFEAVRALEGLPEDIVLIPLTGHTRGHTGVAVPTGDGWLLHAGDAFFHHGEIDPAGPHCPAGLRVFQSLVQEDRTARLVNRARLLELARGHADEVDVFCAHDPSQLRSHQPA